MLLHSCCVIHLSDLSVLRYAESLGERQAWKKAKALVSQRASDRTRRKGVENVEKDFAEADQNANRLFDLEEPRVEYG